MMSEAMNVDAWLDLLDAQGERAALRALGLEVWDRADGQRVCGGVEGVALVEVERPSEGYPLGFYIAGRGLSARAFMVALLKVAARLRGGDCAEQEEPKP